MRPGPAAMGPTRLGEAVTRVTISWAVVAWAAEVRQSAQASGLCLGRPGSDSGYSVESDPVKTAYRLPAGEVSPPRYARALCRQVRNCFIAAALHLKPLLDGR